MTAEAALEPRTANEAINMVRIKPMSNMQSEELPLDTMDWRMEVEEVTVGQFGPWISNDDRLSGTDKAQPVRYP